MKSFLFTVTFLIFSVSVNAIECKRTSAGILKKAVTVEVTGKQSTITVGENSVDVEIDHNVWDGHLTGLKTGRGFAFQYESQNGCIRNVKVTADFRHIGNHPNSRVGYIETITFKGCTGGSTSDEICFGKDGPQND